MIVHRVTRGMLCGPLLGAALLLTACMDPKSDDKRGYTKAPLEHGAYPVKGEPSTAMRDLGRPNQPVGERVEVAAEPAAAAPAGPAANVTLPAGVTQAMVTDGAAIFGGPGNCLACHGAGGSGTPIGPKLADSEWLNIGGDYEEIVALVTAGVPSPKQFPAPMPAKGGSAISEEQVRQVAAYVYSISR